MLSNICTLVRSFPPFLHPAIELRLNARRVPVHSARAAPTPGALVADKVIPGVGLVVTLYDLLEVGSGSIPPSDGAVHFRSTFRLVIFCPFEGEVLVAKLLKGTECVPRAAGSISGGLSNALNPTSMSPSSQHRHRLPE